MKFKLIFILLLSFSFSYSQKLDTIRFLGVVKYNSLYFTKSIYCTLIKKPYSPKDYEKLGDIWIQKQRICYCDDKKLRGNIVYIFK